MRGAANCSALFVVRVPLPQSLIDSLLVARVSLH
jgi:hypothetical protein